jgi:hypothetical protein
VDATRRRYREASFYGADGVVDPDRQDFFEPEPPPRLRRKVASRRFLDAEPFDTLTIDCSSFKLRYYPFFCPPNLLQSFPATRQRNPHSQAVRAIYRDA